MSQSALVTGQCGVIETCLACLLSRHLRGKTARVTARSEEALRSDVTRAVSLLSARLRARALSVCLMSRRILSGASSDSVMQHAYASRTMDVEAVMMGSVLFLASANCPLIGILVSALSGGADTRFSSRRRSFIVARSIMRVINYPSRRGDALTRSVLTLFDV